MTVENYPKCRTCRHYRARETKFGFCGKIPWSPNSTSLAWTESNDGDDSSFRVCAEFGCVLHESVTTDSQ
jgi:hypothetical protein